MISNTITKYKILYSYKYHIPYSNDRFYNPKPIEPWQSSGKRKKPIIK